MERTHKSHLRPIMVQYERWLRFIDSLDDPISTYRFYRTTQSLFDIQEDVNVVGCLVLSCARYESGDYRFTWRIVGNMNQP